MCLEILFLLPYNVIVKCSKCNRDRTRVKLRRHLGCKVEQAQGWAREEEMELRGQGTLGKDFRTE